TRGSAVVSTHWQIDAHAFDLPLVAAPSDAVVSPTTAAEIARLGGLAVLDGEGLWTRYEDADKRLDSIDGDTRSLQQLYSAPVSPSATARTSARRRTRCSASTSRWRLR